MIRFYIDGTTGQKDGTEVTSINPITATRIPVIFKNRGRL